MDGYQASGDADKAPSKHGPSAWNWRKIGSLGLGGLSLFGGIIGLASTGEAQPGVPPPTTQQKVAPSFRAVGDPLKGPLLLQDMVKAEVAAKQAPPAGPDSLVVAKPLALKGDYIKHGVNFSQLLSDKEFTNVDAATADQLQSYLESQNSFLGDYQVDGRRASDMIVDAAKENKINPWLVLTTLEKENSLVSRHSKPHAKVLGASMGYGYTDGGNVVGKSNFAKQIDGGARLLRKLYDQAQNTRFPHKIRVDYGKRSIQVDNAATLALMKYTPHTVDTHLHQLGGGNYRFRTILEDFSVQYNDLISDMSQERT